MTTELSSSRFASFGERGALLPMPRRVIRQPQDPWTHVPDTAVEWADLPGLAVRGASVRGHSHRWEGSVRQDQLAVGEIDDLLVIAVADGLGSQPESHVGAALAARFVATWPAVGDLLSPRVTEFDCSEIRVALQAEANARGVDPVKVSSTLTFAVIRRDPSVGDDGIRRWPVAVAQIGDSQAYLLKDEIWSPLSGAGDTEAALTNVVDPLPKHFRATVRHLEAESGDVLALTTDGVGNLLEDVAEFAQALSQQWADRPPSPAEMLFYLDAAVKTYDDDRTLLAVGFGERGGEGGGERE